MKKLTTPLIALSLLAGCGSGDDTPSSDSAAPATLHAGASETLQVLVADTEVFRQSTVYMEVSQSGTLSSTPLNEQGLGQFLPVVTSTSADAEQPALADASGAFAELWKALQAHYGTNATAAQLLEQFHDLDGSLEEIYHDQQRSGLNPREYIRLYETLDQYFDAEYDEAVFRRFFKEVDITPEDFVDQLAARNQTPADFFQSLQRQQLTLKDSPAHYEVHVLGRPSSTLPAITTSDYVELMASSLNSGTVGNAPTGSFWDFIFNHDNAQKKVIDYISGKIMKSGGAQYIFPFSWTPEIPDTVGGKSIKSDKITVLKTGTLVTAKYEMQVEATVNATSTAALEVPLVSEIKLHKIGTDSSRSLGWAAGMAAQASSHPLGRDACNTVLPTATHTVQGFGGLVLAEVGAGIKRTNVYFDWTVEGSSTGKIHIAPSKKSDGDINALFQQKQKGCPGRAA